VPELNDNVLPLAVQTVKEGDAVVKSADVVKLVPFTSVIVITMLQ
jgi:hypothetical protein